MYDIQVAPSVELLFLFYISIDVILKLLWIRPKFAFKHRRTVFKVRVYNVLTQMYVCNTQGCLLHIIEQSSGSLLSIYTYLCVSDFQVYLLVEPDGACLQASIHRTLVYIVVNTCLQCCKDLFTML